jgi:chaperonin cofactor prefoldin
MSRVKEILDAEKRAMETQVKNLRDRRTKVAQQLSEIDAELEAAIAAQDEFERDVIALPERLSGRRAEPSGGKG